MPCSSNMLRPAKSILDRMQVEEDGTSCWEGAGIPPGTPLEHKPVLWDRGLFQWELCDSHLMGLLCFLLFLTTSAELVVAL